MGKHKSLPSFEQLKNNYPGPAAFPLSVQEVGEKIGGKVKSNLADASQPDYKDTCTIRVSYSLNYSGDPVSNAGGVRVNSGADKKWYVYSVRDFRKYMNLKYGPPDVVKKAKTGSVSSEGFQNKKGIIVFGNFHADLWEGTGCVGHCYFEAVNEVLLWVAP